VGPQSDDSDAGEESPLRAGAQMSDDTDSERPL